MHPLVSASRILDPALLGQERCEVATRVRQTLQWAKKLLRASVRMEDLSEEDRLILSRARKLELFFSQPFYIAEPYTRVPGKWVRCEETVQACKAILEGHYDALPVEAFFFIGNTDEAVEKAKRLKGKGRKSW